ncbi:molybdopterin-dependent oxidoreductase [Halomarina ordinaria]|uniref:Molybdopterin-dependent oxidoreductase n=1 Tax=Halomarina ordinaria TaxID=3033939 RepID=A0ABD5UFG4_9EURY|nr:molybdopterin-dependent oxidoreductase [Halomarina sp. PSRA2]
MPDTRARLRAAGPSLGLALAAGIAGVAGSYLLAGFTPGFVVAPVEATLSRAMPDVVVRYAILLLGSLGQQLNLLTALVLTTLLFALAAGLSRGIGRQVGVPFVGAALAASVVWGMTVTLTGAPVLALGAALPVGLAVAVPDLTALAASDPGRRVDAGRRSALGVLGAALGFGLLSYVVGGRGDSGGGALESSEERRATTEDLLAEAEEKSLPVEGLEPLVSENFYTVDISSVDPDVNAEDWSLTITGAIAEDVALSYDDLTGMDSESKFVSLRCVGESLNGKKMDNALWEVVPIADVLERAGLDLDQCCVRLRAADDYYQVFPVEALKRGYLVYGMNGEALPRAHGYPVRTLIPGHWGEINVKWLTEMEILEQDAEGYWEKRGWHGTGPVTTVAKFHVVNRLDDGRVQVAGHAYAGTRGISRVEVSTDGGESWADATLSEELPGEDVWRQWAYEYDAPGEEHDVVVRAYEGDGTRQPRERREAFPRGATGWVTRTVSPE